MEELKKYTKRFLKNKFFTTTFEELIRREQWWFKGYFKEKLQVLFTNGLSLPENSKIIKIFKELKTRIQKKAKLNEISNLIYEYRIFIFQSISTKELAFYKSFIDEYQIKFKHDGIYKLSYFDDEIRNLEALIRKLDKANKGGNLASVVSDFAKRVNEQINQEIVDHNKKMDSKKKLAKKRYQNAILSQKTFSFKKRTIPRFNESDYEHKPLKTHKGLHNLIIMLEEKELETKASPISLAIALRKSAMIIHLFAKESDFTEEETKEMIRAFFVVFIDSALLLKRS